MVPEQKLTLVLFLFFIVSASLPSTINASGGRHPRIVGEYAAPTEAKSTKKEESDEEKRRVDWRMLKANTNDYGSYDPSPALSKPAFKLIPN